MFSGLGRTAVESEDQMDRTSFLDPIIREHAMWFKLFTSINEATFFTEEFVTTSFSLTQVMQQVVKYHMWICI
jgi:hypothetical protein